MTNIHKMAIVCDKVVHGDNLRVGAFSFICCNTIIGDNVFIGQNVSFCNDKYPPSKGKWKSNDPIMVFDNASIGSGAIILPQVIIGENAIIGAGSVVTKDVPKNTTVKGNPAI